MSPISDGNSRRVYSSDVGRIRDTPGARPAADSGDGVVRVSRTRAGRKGKTVTLVTGIPAAERADVARELRRRCGAGGAVRDDSVEIQGDHRDTVVAVLAGRYRVKPAGG